MKNIEIQNKLINYIKTNTESNDLYWYPLVKLATPISVIAYNLDSLYKDKKMNLLKKVFVKCKINNVDTYCMDCNEYYEKDKIVELLYQQDDYDFCFPRTVETFYFDKSYEWMVYVSHEGTITFTGDKMIDIAKKYIPSKYLLEIKK